MIYLPKIANVIAFTTLSRNTFFTVWGLVEEIHNAQGHDNWRLWSKHDFDLSATYEKLFQPCLTFVRVVVVDSSPISHNEAFHDILTKWKSRNVRDSRLLSATHGMSKLKVSLSCIGRYANIYCLWRDRVIRRHENEDGFLKTQIAWFALSNVNLVKANHFSSFGDSQSASTVFIQTPNVQANLFH